MIDLNTGVSEPAKPQQKKRKKKNEVETETPGVPKKKKRGRPKNAVIVDRSQRSIMTMFKTVTSQSQSSMASSYVYSSACLYVAGVVAI